MLKSWLSWFSSRPDFIGTVSWKWFCLSLREVAKVVIARAKPEAISSGLPRTLFSVLAMTLCVTLHCLYASDVKVKLNSADGSTSFQVRNNADTVVSTITSKGAAIFASSVTVGGDIRVQDNEIFFGATQTDRKIYDDGGTKGIRFSSNVYITGDLRVGAQAYVYRVYITSDTGTVDPTWKNNTAAKNYGGTADILGTDFHPAGKILVRGGVSLRADEAGTVPRQFRVLVPCQFCGIS